MPPNRTTKPFKPQRPSVGNNTGGNTSSSSKSASKSQPTTAAASSRSKSTVQKQKSSSKVGRPRREVEEAEPEEEQEPEEDEQQADIDPFAAPPPATIPPELLTRLLHEFMSQAQQAEGGSGRGTMRISKGADKAVGKYMETFVREAIARAAFERAEAAAKLGGGRAGGVGVDGFLEVEDLEKLAPQLVLDF